MQAEQRAVEPSAPRLRWPVRLVRGTIAILHGSVFWLLALPLVSLETCSGRLGEFTGYQALAGASIRVPSLTGDQPVLVAFAPDWWVAGLIALAVSGIGLALLGGLAGAALGAAADILALIVLQPAIGLFTSPGDAIGWSPESDTGGSLIGFAFFGALVLDLGWMAAKGWREKRHPTSPPDPQRDGWLTAGCLSGIALVVIALAGLALLVLVLALRS